MTTTITEFMGQDHDRLDEIFKHFQGTKTTDADDAKKLFKEFFTGLQRHIVWEEDILFPLFERRSGMTPGQGPTAVMRTEHRHIKEYLDQIHEKVAAGDPSSDDTEHELLEVLTAHNVKEEKVLYPWIDNATNEEEREGLLTQMQNVPPDHYAHCCE